MKSVTIHTKTKEEFTELMVFLEHKGFKWSSGDRATAFNYWENSNSGVYIGDSGRLSYLPITSNRGRIMSVKEFMCEFDSVETEDYKETIKKLRKHLNI